jgi:hypothetical protein
LTDNFENTHKVKYTESNNSGARKLIKTLCRLIATANSAQPDTKCHSLRTDIYSNTMTVCSFSNYSINDLMEDGTGFLSDENKPMLISYN